MCPTYEYEREDGSRFELKQKITDEPLQECPETKQKVKRVICSTQPPIFACGGFYQTDYKKK